MAPAREIPVHDFRDGGLAAYNAHRIVAAARVMDMVLRGMGPGGHALRPALGIGDRIARTWLRRARDPYLGELLALRRRLGRPGPLTFALSYELACTARAFDGAMPVLFRTLDWPFRGLGELVEIVHLSGPAGPWTTATWPGLVGILQGTAPGRFAAALNQAPERRSGTGRAVDWIGGRARVMRRPALPPAHLLRLVFETAPDFQAAAEMLCETPVAAPVIFTLAGTAPGETLVIERTETAAAIPAEPAAANHFAAEGGPAGRAWRPRGYESHARRAQALELALPPAGHDLSPPILNPLTRLAVTADATGALSVTGFDGRGPVTATRTVGNPA